MNFQKSADQPKDPWLATRAPLSATPQVPGRNRKNNPLARDVITKITTNMGGTE